MLAVIKHVVNNNI